MPQRITAEHLHLDFDSPKCEGVRGPQKGAVCLAFSKCRLRSSEIGFIFNATISSTV